MKIKNPVSLQIWGDRYCKNNETENENLRRVAEFCSYNEEEEDILFQLMDERLFYFGGRTMSNAGIGNILTLNNCFCLNSVSDSINDIFDTVRIGALTQKAGGGTGYDFSLIRPNGTPTKNDAIASGAVSFMEVFDSATHTILQGGRRGANMGILNIYHPDIFEFLDSKSFDAGKLVHFNLSVMIDDDFMRAVEDDEDVYLHYPVYDEEFHIIKDPNKWTHSKKQNARELYDHIIQKAYNTGEYGVFFYDNLNRDNNTWYCETITGTNPCGEYVSGVIFKYVINSNDYRGACNLGSTFLHNHVVNPFTSNAYIDFGKLHDTVTHAVRFLDNIIDKNIFPHPSFENYQKNMRTIGLGISGLADLFTMMNMKYGSPESVNLANEIMNFVAKTAYKASINLAKEKGSFPFLDKEKFIESGFIQKHIKYDEAWKEIASDILKYGIRNARLLSVAPVGTLSLTFGENSSSGLEPIIATETKRKVKMNGQDEENIQIVALRDYAYNLWLDTEEDNIVYENVFVTIKDLGVQEHLDVLKAITFHVDMSASKTINLPSAYSFDQTKDVYKWCWENGIKGCTIFRPNELRQGIFIEDDENELDSREFNEGFNESQLPWGTTIEASDDLIGRKKKIISGCGSLHLQAWFDPENGKLMEIYLSKGSSGGCNSFMISLSRVISLALRTGVSFDYAIDQLQSVPACNSYTNRNVLKKDCSKGSSCPSAIANALIKMQKEVLNEIGFEDEEEKTIIKKPLISSKSLEVKLNNEIISDKLDYISKHGEIAFAKKFGVCPLCGDKLEHIEGCLSCACGWTKCG